MRTYRTFFNTQNNDAETYGLYCWNESLAAELFKLISSVEISMRNRYHRALSSYYAGTARGSNQSNDWYNCIDIKQKDALKTISKYRNHRYPDKTVAALTYGFWMHLYDCRTDIGNRTVNWGAIFPDVVPGHRQSDYNYWRKPSNQDKLFARVYAVNQLRNRIAHHEPVWKFGPEMEERRKRSQFAPKQLNAPPANVTSMLQRLNDTHRKAVELLSWFSPDRAQDYLSSQTHHEFKRLASSKGINDYKNMPRKKEYQIDAFKEALDEIVDNQDAVKLFKDRDYKGTFYPY